MVGYGGMRVRNALRQIEQENLGAVSLSNHGELGLVLYRGAIAGIEPLPIRLDRAACDLKPSIATVAQGVCCLFTVIEDRSEQLDILMDDDRAVASFGGTNETQPAALFGIGELLLIVTRSDAFAIGDDPDLQEVNFLGPRGIELAVADAGTGRH